jgi:hypothetical protein
MTTPVPITEDEARRYTQRIAAKCVEAFKRYNVVGMSAVTVTVRLSNGREISAEARNE